MVGIERRSEHKRLKKSDTQEDLGPVIAYLKEIGSVELLKPEEEIQCGQDIFAAKLALRNLQRLADSPIISQDQQSGIQEILSHNRNRVLLDTLNSEIKNKTDSEDPDDKSFMKDLKRNDDVLTQDLQVLYTLEDLGDREKFQEVVSEFIKEKKSLVEKGLEADKKFVEHNLRLVVSIVKKIRGSGLAFFDLIQEGNTGLMRASAKFDSRKGYRFSTYASWWIRQAALRAIPENVFMIRLPANLNEALSKARRKQNEMQNKTEEEVRLEEVIKSLGYGSHKEQSLIASVRQTTVASLDMPLFDEDGSPALIDFQSNPDENIEEQTSANLLKETVKTAINNSALSDREKKVLELRFGLIDGRSRTLEEAGIELGVTRERIRQIETKALSKLRNPNTANKLRESWNDSA